ncbi:TonB-linked SusC/RagA family outer membrane protein [Wenyingzhuangia heitensis]|uniref:TonB-linked SusC/RagA family outer membrane protein n=1 Tax=Wenyingzhuangia heitensis TaxID=1487859 RepID=A0ABX0UBY9_9FLAO|nr:TonB-dependent receptor [Wenyingzhuangia heitensis]NIJ45340.1 TonB-linked SusC/RagA family outer membrane protein [Wenyingzhuangia heitensis]
MKEYKKIEIETIVRKIALIMFLSLVCFQGKAYAQNKITGVVTSSADGLPLIGATVQKLGSKLVTSTDFDGQYIIKAKEGDVLQFSYLGMLSRTLTIKGNVLNVTLDPDQQELDEVVLIGYGSVKKKEITGAVARVKAEDIENIVTSDLGSALQGQVSGVNIVSSAEPGGGSDILIRGVTSLTGSNDPLYVVDGVIQDGDPRIAPNEIETIDVLKDAASTAIYGTQGAAGVILITTKQGEAGSLRVAINSSYGIKVLNGSPTRLMNANEQLFSILVQSRNSTSLTLGDDQLDLGFSLQPTAYQNDTNLYDYVVIDNQPTQNHSLSISGGTKEIKYNVTTGFFQQVGTLVNSKFERFNVRANTAYTKDKWDIKANIAVTTEKNQKSPGGLITQTIKYSPLQQDLQNNDVDEELVSLGGSTATVLGWVLDSFQNENEINTIRASTTFNAIYKFTDKFRLTSRVGLSSYYSYGHTFNPLQEVTDVFGNSRSPASSSSVGNSAQKRLSQTFDLFANYKFDFLKDHNVNLTAGGSFQNSDVESFSARASGVVDNSIKVLNGARLNPSVESGPDSTTNTFGMLLRVQYNYKGKYIFSSSVRRDASSRFSEDNRSAIFPSASFAWNVSDEDFWNDIKSTANNFRLRASYGAVGNERVGNYLYQSIFTTNYQYAYGRSGNDNLVNGNIQNGYANEKLKWETSIQSNFGFDLSLFKNKFTLTGEYYRKTNEEMLFPIQLAGSTGAANNSTIVLNIGNMKNQGFEFASKYRTNVGKVKVNMSATFSTNDNEVSSVEGLGRFTLANDSGLISGAKDQSQVTAIATGYEAGAYFIYSTDGIVNTSEKLAEYQKISPQARMGDLIIVDTNNDGEITNDDRTYRGSGLPDFEIGYNLNTNYKGFDFSMNWYAAIGHEIMNGSKATAFGYGRHQDLIYQWSEINPVTSVPSYKGAIKNHANYNGNTDLWLEKGDYLRLKAATIGYSLSKKSLEKLGGLSKFRIYATAQNPITFTKYSGYDPSVGGNIANRGLDKGAYPITATYLLGLNLNF